MRGFFHHQGIEYSIVTSREAWAQGDELELEFTITNSSAIDLDLNSIGVQLRHCQIKDIRAKSDKGAELASSSWTGQTSTLAPGEKTEAKFSFQLPKEVAITDQKASLFLFFGPTDNSQHLQLNILPLPLFVQFIKVLETFQRFKLKKIVSKKSTVEYTMTPPLAKEWSALKTLIITLKLTEDATLEIQYEGRGEKLDLSGQAGKTEKTVTKKDYKLLKKQYFMGDTLDSAAVQNHFAQALAEFKPSWM
jgi:sporulation-control protein spo0M